MSKHYIEEAFETEDGRGTDFVQAVNTGTYFDYKGKFSDSSQWTVRSRWSVKSPYDNAVVVNDANEAKAYARLFNSIAESFTK